MRKAEDTDSRSSKTLRSMSSSIDVDSGAYNNKLALDTSARPIDHGENSKLLCDPLSVPRPSFGDALDVTSSIIEPLKVPKEVPPQMQEPLAVVAFKEDEVLKPEKRTQVIASIPLSLANIKNKVKKMKTAALGMDTTSRLEQHDPEIPTLVQKCESIVASEKDATSEKQQSAQAAVSVRPPLEPLHNLLTEAENPIAIHEQEAPFQFKKPEDIPKGFGQTRVKGSTPFLANVSNKMKKMKTIASRETITQRPRQRARVKGSWFLSNVSNQMQKMKTIASGENSTQRPKQHDPEIPAAQSSLNHAEKIKEKLPALVEKCESIVTSEKDETSEKQQSDY